MIKKKHIKTTTLLILLVTQICLAQDKTCASADNEFLDLNTIGKCAIEQFKTSKNKEFIQVSSRSRFVRRKQNVHLTNLKEHLKTVPQKKEEIVDKKSIVDTSAASKATISLAANNAVDANNELIIKDYLRFDQVSKAPIFITCDSSSANDFKEECNKETIVGVILENLVYPFDAAASGIEGKVWVRFVIDKEGYVKNVTTKGPENGALLEQEAARLVKLLPKFLPGKHHNEYVNVEYFMPIEFHID